MPAHILWLCSWYPHEALPYDGDFIQRQAQAVSALLPVQVIHVAWIGSDHPQSIQIQQQGQLTVYHYRLPKQRGLYGNLQNLKRFLALHEQHILQYGKPMGVHVQVPMKAGIAACWLKWRHQLPFLVSEHYGIYNPYVHDHYRTRSVWFRMMTYIVLKQAAALVTVSHSLGKDIQRWVTAKPFHVIPNVVDTSLFQYTSPPPISPFRFIHVSNMAYLKNVDGILDAWLVLCKDGYDGMLTICGPVHPPIQQRVANDAILKNQVHFTDELSYEEVAAQLKQQHALVLFSDTESQSCVTLEALCCGRPVIVPAVGGVQELVHENNGLTVSVRNTEDLVEKMKQLISSYAQYNLEEIAEEAAGQFQYATIGAAYHKLYHDLFSGRN